MAITGRGDSEVFVNKCQPSWYLLLQAWLCVFGEQCVLTELGNTTKDRAVSLCLHQHLGIYTFLSLVFSLECPDLWISVQVVLTTLVCVLLDLSFRAIPSLNSFLGFPGLWIKLVPVSYRTAILHFASFTAESLISFLCLPTLLRPGLRDGWCYFRTPSCAV